jgi:hypothetical protein
MSEDKRTGIVIACIIGLVFAALAVAGDLAVLWLH